MLDITRDKPVKVAVKVAVPVRDHPKVGQIGTGAFCSFPQILFIFFFFSGFSLTL